MHHITSCSPLLTRMAAPASQASAAALITTVMPLADVTNRLNGNKSCWKVPVPEEIQLFTRSDSQDAGKPVQSHCHTSHRYTQPHGKHPTIPARPLASAVYTIVHALTGQSRPLIALCDTM